MSAVIIVGGGLMGSATAWQLARAGKKVLLLEKQDEIYDQGSSYGEARVTRSLGVEDDIFTYLKETSVHETKTLISLLNQWDDQSHDIRDIHTDSPVTYLYDQSLRSDVDLLVRDNDYQTAYSTDEQERLFGINIPDKIIIRENKACSGTVNPKELIRKLKRGIRLCGGEIRHNTQVTDVTQIDNLVEVTYTDLKSHEFATITSPQLVVCSGPYTPEILKNISPVFKAILTLKRLYLSFFQLNPNYWEALASDEQERFRSFFPIANFNDEVYYSMIEKMQNGVPLIKVGGHYRRFEIEDRQNIWNDQVPESEISWAKNETIQYLHGIGFKISPDQLEFTDGYSCVYTLTESEVPIVSPALNDQGEVLNNIIIVAGLSGIGAKGTLAYGRHAADYILGNDIHDPMYQKAKKEMGIDRLKGL